MGIDGNAYRANGQCDHFLRKIRIKGSLSGEEDTTDERTCGDNVQARGMNAQTEGGWNFVLATMGGDTGDCAPWIYQSTWTGSGATGIVYFANGLTTGFEFDSGLCELIIAIPPILVPPIEILPQF